jgi:glycosyltransferase involved in cell wall biosynthesis
VQSPDNPGRLSYIRIKAVNNNGRARPLVSIVLPAYNEAGVLEQNLRLVLAELRQLEPCYRFEVLIVNDGSLDQTGRLADELAAKHPVIRVLHHARNRGLGCAFRTAFAASQGNFVITLDVDLSYSPDHVGRLLECIERTGAQIVLASPYMPGGQLTNVPWLRRTLSVWGNRFLRLFARGGLSTLTCMVRAYDGPFVRALVLRSVGMEIMPEIIYKTMLLRGSIEQIPAHLDWTKQVADGPPKRSSSMRIISHIFSTVISGFIFRPFMFLILPGLLTLAFATYVGFWMLAHLLAAFAGLPPETPGGRATAAFALAYQAFPHTYVIGFLSALLGVLLIGLGMLALQAKKYYEEGFYLQMSIREEVTKLRRD